MLAIAQRFAVSADSIKIDDHVVSTKNHRQFGNFLVWAAARRQHGFCYADIVAAGFTSGKKASQFINKKNNEFVSCVYMYIPEVRRRSISLMPRLFLFDPAGQNGPITVNGAEVRDFMLELWRPLTGRAAKEEISACLAQPS